VTEVADVFHALCRDVHMQRKKSKQSLLDRMLGNKGNSLRAYSRGKSDSALP
jgi:Ras-like protein family protein 11A